MFTGLVEDLGRVVAIDADREGAKLKIATALASEISAGDSIAVKGACLTADGVSDDDFSAYAINETLAKTSLGSLSAGDPVNLELAMKADGRFGGHIVQGHVDGTGEIVAIREDGAATVVSVAAPAEILRYVVQKGSITVDGISLTVSDVSVAGFEVSLIPETLARTTMGGAAQGDVVNLETDMFAKYAEKLAVG